MAAASVESKAFDFVKVLHKKTVHLIQVPHLVITGNCGRWSPLLGIKLGDLEPLQESSLEQQ